MGDPGGRLSRRDLARWSLFGGASLTAAVVARRGPVPVASAAPSARSAAASTSGPADGGAPWWLRDNFAPVADEVDAVDLEVQGAIPPLLSGRYVRNGSNPAAGDSPHWFFGDGMVHGIRLEAGRATAYRNRYVRTAMYEAGAGFGEGPPGGASNQSNVSSIWHGGRLLTSGEVGLPYELDPSSLSTIGAHDFGGALTSSFTAHPKIDPATGRLHSFGYGFVPPYLTYHVVEPDGTMSHTSTVDIPRSTMMHDFAITETDVVFWDLPVVFDLEAAVRFIDDSGDPANFPYRWQPEAGARLGLMPLAGGALQWFDIEPCFVFHGVNAARHGTDVVIEVCALSSMFEPGQVLGGAPTLRRWTLDTTAGRVTEDILEAERALDLPTRDPRLVGRAYRYGYLVENRPASETVDLGGVVKFDVTTGASEVWDPGPTFHGGEWLFVPAGDDTAEDAGHLLGFVHDDATDRTEFVILDAIDVTAGPVARIAVPQRVPYGFHATWIPD